MTATIETGVVAYSISYFAGLFYFLPSRVLILIPTIPVAIGRHAQLPQTGEVLPHGEFGVCSPPILRRRFALCAVIVRRVDRADRDAPLVCDESAPTKRFHVYGIFLSIGRRLDAAICHLRGPDCAPFREKPGDANCHNPAPDYGERIGRADRPSDDAAHDTGDDDCNDLEHGRFLWRCAPRIA